MLARIPKENRLINLTELPFKLKEPIDAKSATVILEAFKSGIDPAIQNKRLPSLYRFLPRSDTAVECADNLELAISMLDLLLTDKVRKTNAWIPEVVNCVKAVALYQSGKTDAAVEIATTLRQNSPSSANYQVRNFRNWLDREITSTAIDRQIDLIEKDIKDGKPTVAQTDKRLAIIKQSGNEDALRSAYLQAIQDHSDVAKYVTAYERFEKQYRRPAALIDFYEKKLADTTNPSTEAKLADLLVAFDQLPKAMPYWRTAADDQKKSAFERQKEKRAQTQLTEKDQKNTKVATTGAKQKKNYASSIQGVKQAIDERCQASNR